MKFECDSCHAQYMIADEKLGTRGVKVKCKRCSHVIIVRPATKADAAEAPAEPEVNEDAPTASTPAPDTFLDRDARVTAPDEHEGVAAGFDDEPTRATFDADTEVAGVLGDDTVAGDVPAPAFAAAHDDDGDDDAADDEADLAAPGAHDEDDDGDNPFLAEAAGAGAEDPFRGLGDLGDDNDEDETRADASAARAAFAHDDGAGGPLSGTEEGAADHGSLRMDSELDANPFFGEGPSPASDEEASLEPGLDAAGDVPAPPPPDAVPGIDDGTAAGAMPPVGEGEDLLEGELAGAFGAMFADPDEGGQERGPTQVLDLGRVDQLRAESLRSEMQGGGLDDLRSGLDASLDAPFGGKSPFVSGVHDVGATMEGPPEGSQASEPEDDGEWHAAIDDEDVGPLTLKEIGEHIKKGSVDRETLVWRPGMDDWTPAGEVREVRPLFDAVPRPRISAAEGVASFDVGAPIDDLGPSPFTSGDGRTEVKDPFGAIPGFDTDDNDGAWQPHGLTEVYQAANLAEAAGGLGAAAAPAVSSAANPLDDDEEVDWKPGAGSALASLVSSEIERLDSPRFGEGSLPPAADDSLALDLDSAPLGGVSSPGLGGLGSLDVPAESDDALAAPPAFGSVPPTGAPAVSGAMAPTQSLAGMPMAPYPGMPTSPLKNPLVLIAAVGGTVIVLLFVVVLLLVFREPPAPVIAQQPVPGAPVPAGQVPGQATPTAPNPAEPAAAAAPTEAAPEPAAAAAAPETPPTPATEAPELVADTASAASAEPAATAAATPSEAPAAAPAATPPAAKKEERPTRVASAQKKAPERKAQRRQQRRQQPKPRVQPVQRTRDCDPVLDLDCDEKPLRGSSSSRAQKAELTPSDVLAVIKRNLRTVNSCASKHGAKGTLKMEWRILKSGATSSVRVASPNFAGTPVGDCVTNAIKRWKFPASNKPPREAIKFPFKLSG